MVAAGLLHQVLRCTSKGHQLRLLHNIKTFNVAGIKFHIQHFGQPNNFDRYYSVINNHFVHTTQGQNDSNMNQKQHLRSCQ